MELRIYPTKIEGFTLRETCIEDSQTIFNFILKIAKYEQLEHEVLGSVDLIKKHLFDHKHAEVLLACLDNKPIGFALFFHNFSTFLTKPGLYLEDFFLDPEHRNKGFGKEIFNTLLNIAKERDCGRMEWVCLNWNTPSIKFYKKMGAIPLDEWTTYRIIL